MAASSTGTRLRTPLLAALSLLAVLAFLPATSASAAHPGGNGLIAFERGADIWLAEPDGSNPRNLTNTPSHDERDPVVSPDGTRVAYTRTDVYDEIWAISIDGTGLTEVSNPLGHEVLGSAEEPTWSPDGSRIAFQGFHGGEGRNVLWLVQADGSGGGPVTTGYTAETPDWGAHGEIVVAVAGDFYAVDPATGSERVLLRYTDAPERPYTISDPEWSPDGSSVVFTCDTTRICAVDADGSGWRWLTESYNAVLPQFSPDGQWILYAGTGADSAFGDYDLWRIPAGGVAQGHPERLTSGPAVDRDPDWGPAAVGAPTPPPPPPPGGDGQPAAEAFDDDPATTERIDAADPVAAAIEISRARFAAPAFAQIGGGGASWVVLSRDDDFPDSLAGSALTAGGPMLFTSSTSLTASTRDEISRVLAPGGRIYLLGGAGAISQGIEDQLRAAGYDVRRLQGPSRVETALAVADEVRTVFEGDEIVLLARAGGPADNPTAGWADSVSGGGIAAYGGVPILVTPSDSLHPAVSSWLAQDGPQRTVLLGGTAALSGAIEAAVPAGERVAGGDRTATATAIATQLWPDGTGDRFVVVNGFDPHGWAFGLAAAGVAADAAAPVVLVGDQVSPATGAAVSSCGQPQVDVLLVGGSSVISPAVAAELDRLDGEGCDAGGGGDPADPPPADPPSGGPSPGSAGRWVAEQRSLVLELEFSHDGAAITDIAGRLHWYCDGSTSTTITPFHPQDQSIPVSGGSWTYDHEFDDGEGNTYREVFNGRFTSATTAQGTLRYEFAGNGSYCFTGDVQWTAAPS